MAPTAVTARLSLLSDHRRIRCHLRPAVGVRPDVPNRPIYIYLVFPIPAKYFVMIMRTLLSSIGDTGGGIAHITHLGGLIAGYLLLRGKRFRPMDEARYRYLKWKMNRSRKKFGVYSGGRSDWDKHVH